MVRTPNRASLVISPQSLFRGWCQCKAPLPSDAAECGSCQKVILSPQEELLVGGQMWLAREMRDWTRAVIKAAERPEPPPVREPSGLLMTADQVADLLGAGITSEWVLDNRNALGAFTLVDGAKPRVYFRRAAIEEFLRRRSEGEAVPGTLAPKRRAKAKRPRRLQAKGRPPC